MLVRGSTIDREYRTGTLLKLETEKEKTYLLSTLVTASYYLIYYLSSKLNNWLIG